MEVIRVKNGFLIMPGYHQAYEKMYVVEGDNYEVIAQYIKEIIENKEKQNDRSS